MSKKNGSLKVFKELSLLIAFLGIIEPAFIATPIYSMLFFSVTNPFYLSNSLFEYMSYQ